MIGVEAIFLDTAPVIYYVEAHATFGEIVEPLFEMLDASDLRAVTSPVTLAEAMVLPLRANDSELWLLFQELLISGPSMRMQQIDGTVGLRAARIRAEHNVTLTDAFQLAAAIEAGCDAFLTNDSDLRRVTEIRVLILSDFESGRKE
jgi:predicted nucleic acid-binding protein